MNGTVGETQRPSALSRISSIHRYRMSKCFDEVIRFECWTQGLQQMIRLHGLVTSLGWMICLRRCFEFTIRHDPIRWLAQMMLFQQVYADNIENKSTPEVEQTMHRATVARQLKLSEK